MTGEIKDGKTIAGVLKAKMYFDTIEKGIVKKVQNAKRRK